MKKEPPATARDLVTALLDAANQVAHQLDGPLSQFKGLSLSEYQLLAALGDQHRATATRVDLAAAVRMTPSGVTRALRPLEKLGYVETKKDERDARRSLAALTRHGHKLVAESSKLIDEAVADMQAFSRLDPAQRGAMQRLLQDLARG